MPLVRMTVSVGCDDLPSRPGATVQLSTERAQQVIRNGWAEYVRAAGPETPERRLPRPERAVEAPERATAAPRTPEAPEATEVASEPGPTPPSRKPRTPRKPKS